VKCELRHSFGVSVQQVGRRLNTAWILAGIIELKGDYRMLCQAFVVADVSFYRPIKKLKQRPTRAKNLLSICRHHSRDASCHFGWEFNRSVWLQLLHYRPAILSVRFSKIYDDGSR